MASEREADLGWAGACAHGACASQILDGLAWLCMRGGHSGERGGSEEGEGAGRECKLCGLASNVRECKRMSENVRESEGAGRECKLCGLASNLRECKRM